MVRAFRWLCLSVALVVGPPAALAQDKPASAPARRAQPALRPQGQAAIPPGVKALRDLEYARVGHRPLLLDLYLPEAATGKLPVVVWIHGGGWRAGSKERCPAVWMVPRGYAVASVGYRLSGEAKFPAQIEDCKAAIRFLRAGAAKYGLDPDRIGAWGASAGGHLAALLGTAGEAKELEGPSGEPRVSSRVQAVCDWFGPADLSRLGTPGARSPVTLLLGGLPDENVQLARMASPISYVSKDDPPFLIMHGDRDRLVPLSQSQLLHEALKKAGVESTWHVVQGAGHGFAGPEVAQRVLQFFDRHLRLIIQAEPVQHIDVLKAEDPATRKAVERLLRQLEAASQPSC